MLKIAVFVSGRGSNLQALLNRFHGKSNKIEFSAVVSNKNDCPALDLADKYGIPKYIVGKSEEAGSITYDRLAGEFERLNIGLLVLAGYLKKIPDDFVDNFKDKIINIHPALLPSFGGKGMYGMNVHKAVFDSSAQVSGVTVHFVDKIYDNGKIIAQRCVDISNIESAEEIAGRVLRVEHELLPAVVEKFAADKVLIKNNRVYIRQ